MASPRSYLFVPGNRPERFVKALASGADAVIVDLEDAVPPEAKPAARDAVAAWLAPERAIVLRINAAGTPGFEDDLVLARRPGVAAVMLPKAERAADIAALGALSVIALLESATGLANARAIAACANVQRLAFGAIDFQLDLGLQGGFEDLLAFRSEIALASRLAQLAPPVDSPSVAIERVEEVEREARAARRLGFGGKLCIHPRQVAVVNAAFAPTAEELAWAARVVEAARASGGAAVQVDGKMIDRPVILRAQRLLQHA